MKGLFFSDYLKPVAKKIKFAAIISWRRIMLLFRKDKNLQLLYLDYSTKNIFDKSYFIIHYEFLNALWFEFIGIKKTTGDKYLVIDIEHYKQEKIVLKVQGYKKQVEFVIDITPGFSIESTTFRTATNNLQINLNSKKFNTGFDKMPLVKLIQKELNSRVNDIKIKSSIKLERKQTNIHHSSFKQADFI